MENPATWTKATHVIQAALDEAYKQQTEGVIGLSMARIIHDALEREHLLAEGDGWIAWDDKQPAAGEKVMFFRKGTYALGYKGETFGLGNVYWRPLPAPPSVQEEKGSSDV